MDPTKVTNILQAIEFYDSDYVGKAKDSKKLQAELDRIAKAKRYLDSPDDIRNLVVICRKHHRLKTTGMHTITFPIWLAMAAVPSRGGILSKDQIILAAERVKMLDEQLASFAENNYQPVDR